MNKPWTATRWQFRELTRGEQALALMVFEEIGRNRNAEYIVILRGLTPMGLAGGITMRLAEYLRQEGFDHEAWQNVPPQHLTAMGKEQHLYFQVFRDESREAYPQPEPSIDAGT